MLDIFSETKYLEKGLDAAWQRNEVITNNIANADTPGFTSKRVEFESVLKSAIEDEASGFETKRTEAKHMTFSGMDTVEPMVVENHDTTVRADGNNVDIDYENAQLAKNAIYYQTLVEKLTSHLTRLRMAITEGR